MMVSVKVSERCVWGWCYQRWGGGVWLLPLFHRNIGWIQIKLVIPEVQFITLVGRLIENQDGESITAWGITLSSSVRLMCVRAFAWLSREGFAWVHKSPKVFAHGIQNTCLKLLHIKKINTTACCVSHVYTMGCTSFLVPQKLSTKNAIVAWQKDA